MLLTIMLLLIFCCLLSTVNGRLKQNNLVLPRIRGENEYSLVCVFSTEIGQSLKGLVAQDWIQGETVCVL